MSEVTFQLRVFSSSGLEVEALVRSVTVPTQAGELGFLANHREYVGLLSTGFVEFVKANEPDSHSCLVSGGICAFSDNVLTLLADSVDRRESFDSSLLSEDVEGLKQQLRALSLFDAEWEMLSNRVARIEALRTFGAQ